MQSLPGMAFALGVVLQFSAAPVAADGDGTHLVIGPEQVWIEQVDPVEIMWVGPNLYDRTQVLSGNGLRIVATITEPSDVALLGAKVIVVEKMGTHSCEAGDARAYHVIVLQPKLATEGPATSCAELSIGWSNGAILAEADPMRMTTEDGGEFWIWQPGRGFVDQVE